MAKQKKAKIPLFPHAVLKNNTNLFPIFLQHFFSSPVESNSEYINRE
ncbi:hypothetical protein [Terrimonas alba]